MTTSGCCRKALAGAWALVAAGAMSASAQVAPQPGAAVLEEVVVTGSRIARDANLSGPLPVQSVTAERIRASGEFSIADVVNDVPALLTSVTAEQSIDSGPNGANVLNLRGLGYERTLVLVDGRRHVGGLQGTSAVDIGSIPMPLVERVEVLTGGASAVYGADAVTGVINFILRDDYDGLQIDAGYSMSEYGDGAQGNVSAVWGRDFLDDRANLSLAVDLRRDNGLAVSERPDGQWIGSAGGWVNPDLRFQKDDIGQATPNFARYYNYANTGLTDYGLPIPTTEEFVSRFTAAFGTSPTLTAAELALIERAAQAPRRAVLPGRTFPITSGYGYVVPGNPYTLEGFDPELDVDLDNNGTPDCLDSFTGYNAVVGAASNSVAGGCWNVDAEGGYRPVRDGLVAGTFQGFGGDSFSTARNPRSDIVLPGRHVAINVMGNFDLNDRTGLFAELKYVTQETDTDIRPGSFWDLLFGAADNPFIPDFLRDVADAAGGIAITVDPLFFDARRRTRRDTFRFVGGVEGEFPNGLNHEFSVNYGRFDQRDFRTGQVIVDRFFAAIDAVTDPSTDLPACRADVDPNAPAMNTRYRIPAYQAGYFSFTPGSGDCVPLNIWAGQRGVAPDAAAWVTTPELNEFAIEQFVFAATVTGETAAYFELPGGPAAFAVGAEFRGERAVAVHDSWQRGIIPPGSPFPAGTPLGDVSGNASLTFRPQLGIKDEFGEYDTADVFVELSLPLLSGAPFARELTLDAALRRSDYSTIGRTDSWKTNLLWAPVDALSLRASVSQSVRAPNVTELFGPEIGASFRPLDPCDAAQIDALVAENPVLGNNYLNNCISDLQGLGLDPFDAEGTYNFADPLSASFGGVNAGNPDLSEETARTITYGLVYRPTFLSGLSLTVDYWRIRIEDAIESVTAQNIVDGCYQGASLNASFCELFARNADPQSAQFGGFNFLRTIDINFARLTTRGVDLSLSYDFSFGAHDLNVTAGATRVRELDFFTNPGDLDEVNPELGESRRPELAGNFYLRWERGALTVDWQSQYLGTMLLRSLEIETAGTLYGDVVIMDRTWLHDLNISYAFGETTTLRAGVRNVTGEKPFITDRAFPVSPRGRMFYAGAVVSLR